MFIFYSFKIKKIFLAFCMCLILTVAGVAMLVRHQGSKNALCPDCAAISTQAGISQNTEQKTVYLTFDDGPSPTTETILNVLKEKGVTATFFVISDDNTKPYFNLLKRAQEEGHLVALHSSTHDYKKIYKSTDAFWADLDELRAELAPFVNDIPNILRFPGGSTNSVSKKYGPPNLMKTLLQQAAEKGYMSVDWNICVNDAVGGKKSREDIVRAATKIGEKKSCIVLFHDSKVNKASAAALPEIIEWYKQAGFSFSTVASLKP